MEAVLLETAAFSVFTWSVNVEDQPEDRNAFEELEGSEAIEVLDHPEAVEEVEHPEAVEGLEGAEVLKGLEHPERTTEGIRLLALRLLVFPAIATFTSGN